VVNIVTGQTQQLTELLPAGGRRCIRAFLTQFGDFDSVELVQVRATAMQKWRIVRLGFGTSWSRMAIEWWTNPKPLGTELDSGTIPNGLEGFWIRPSFKDPFLSRRAKP
jgi:hypothetical protein